MSIWSMRIICTLSAMHIGFKWFFGKNPKYVYVHMYAHSPYKSVQKCRGRLKWQPGSFSDGQIKLDLFWKGKHKSILHGLCPCKAKNPLWFPKLNFKGLSLLCSGTLRLSQNYVFFKVITWEKNSCQIYKKINFRIPHFSSQIK